MKKDSITFWDHLDVLRRMFLRIFIVLTILIIVFFFLMSDIFDSVILAPSRSDFILYQKLCSLGGKMSIFPDFCNQESGIKIININLTTPFFIHISTSAYLAVIFLFPYLLWEFWRFVMPALYKHEKTGVKKAFLCSSGLFYTGISVGYFLVFPLIFRFLSNYQLSHTIPNEISLDSYMDNFLMLVFIMGIVFEMPILFYILHKLGLIDRNFFSTYRKYAIVAILILAAIITPTGDPYTLLAISLPLYFLYEVSFYFVGEKSKR